MLDIAEGDILVDGSKEYPVKSASEWEGLGSTQSFRRLATKTFSTKRSVMSEQTKKRGLPTQKLTGLIGTPIDPISASAIQALQLKTNELGTPEELKQCIVSDGTSFSFLILQEPKR